MPMFKVGDVVVPKKVKFYLNTETHRHYSYTGGMRELMEDGVALNVYHSTPGQVNAGNYNWHPDDLEFYQLDLENK